MPFKSRRAKLRLDKDTRSKMTVLSVSRKEPLVHVERAKMILAYEEGETISGIAKRLGTNRPKVERCIDKALQIGALAALDDLPRSGKPPNITAEANAWIISLACQKPKELGYSYELWTTRLLAKHAREHCESAGHSCLAKFSRGTVSKILSKNEIRPHKIKYYLEKRDPRFDEKMAQVLHVYREVSLIHKKNEDVSLKTAILSYDEKPGIQAIENKAPDLSPKPGEYPCVARDYEYIRHGTVTLMGGIDLLTGKAHGIVVDRHRSEEFVTFLKMLDSEYASSAKIRMILDNHSAHTSKETRAFLATMPNRFEFIFTPTHGSWLNLIESFFSKMARTMLRGIRVSSKDELKRRIEKYLSEVNAEPVIYRWKWNLDDTTEVKVY
jgi:transposase